MKYCTKCAKKLVKKKDEAQKHSARSGAKFSQFDSETGKQLYVEWKECPNYKWWNGHDGYIPKIV